jgi:hypothetical protein
MARDLACRSCGLNRRVGEAMAVGPLDVIMCVWREGMTEHERAEPESPPRVTALLDACVIRVGPTLISAVAR